MWKLHKRRNTQILTNQSIKDTIVKNNTILYSILNKLNINTTWIGNQSLEKSYETIIKENKNIYLIDALHSVLSFKKHKDEELIKVFDTIERDSKSNFTTIHMIGSHCYHQLQLEKTNDLRNLDHGVIVYIMISPYYV